MNVLKAREFAASLSEVWMNQLRPSIRIGEKTKEHTLGPSPFDADGASPLQRIIIEIIFKPNKGLEE